MAFFKPIDSLLLTIVSHFKPIRLRRSQNGYIYILFLRRKHFNKNRVSFFERNTYILLISRLDFILSPS